MLESLRSFVGSWVAKILLVLLVASFAVWGVAGSVFDTGPGSSVAQVGDTKVSIYDYVAIYNRNLNQTSQQFGRRLTQDQARALGVEGRSVADVVTGATLDEYARTLNIGLSEDQLAKMIGQNSAFRGSDGKFSRSQFERAVRNAGLSEADFIRLQNNNAIRSQVMASVADGSLLPKIFETAIIKYAGETRTFSYITLDKSHAEALAPVTDGQLKTYFDENAKNYTAPEYRKIAVLALEPKDVADEEAVTDEDIKKDYEDQIATFRTNEKRRVQQIVLSAAKAEQAIKDMESGSTFETVVEENGKKISDVDIGLVEKNTLAKALQDIAFGLKLNEPSSVIKGPFGPTILRVVEIQPESTKPLSEVSASIRKELALRRAADQVINLQTEIEDVRAGGATLQEAAERTNLKVRLIEAVDRSARDKEGTILSDLPSSQKLLSEVFKTEVGEQTSPLDYNTIGSLWYEVLEIEPTRDRSFDEVKTEVRAAFTGEEELKLVTKKADQLKAQLKNGGSLSEIASSLGLSVQQTGALKRGANEDNFPATATNAGFEGNKNSVSVADGKLAGSKILLQVTNSSQPEAEISDAAKREIELANLGASNDLLEQLIGQLQLDYPVSVNRELMQQVIARQ